MRVRGYAPAAHCWTELFSSDPTSAADFYRGLFGWQVATSEAGTDFTVRGLAVAGLTATRRRPKWLPYFATEDIQASVTAVSEAGGRVLSPPVEVGARGHAAVVADTEGATFGVWQRGTFPGAQLINEPDTVSWCEVATRDPAGATTFYGKVFGWVDQPGEMTTTYEYRDWQVANRVVGGLIPMTGAYFPAGIPPHWRLTIEVDGCDEVASRCAACGGHVVLGPIDLGIGRFAQLLDPQGAAIGVIELVPELRLTR